MNVAAVILAAGLSSRMGEHKPLLPVGDRTMLAHGVGLFQACGVKTIMVVAGHGGAAVREESLRLGVECCENPDYPSGMLSSVQTALRRLPNVDGFFLLPVDIPLVRPVTIRRLLHEFDSKRVLIPAFQGHIGHPPLIPGRMAGKIVSYAGPGGLDRFLHKQKRRKIDVWDRGVLLDADTPEEYRALQRRWARLAMGDPFEAEALAMQIMPERGIVHGRMVAAVARTIGQRLSESGIDLDLELVHNAALLHDIAKGEPFHEQRGGAILAELGLHVLSHIVTAHRDIGPPESGDLTEKEVVGLADKFVRAGTVIPLRQRYQEKLTRYRTDRDTCLAISKRLERAEALLAMVEDRIGCKVEQLLATAPFPLAPPDIA